MSDAQKMFLTFELEKDARAHLMPTTKDALNRMFECYLRLKELGWREAIYCPKDGTVFDAIEAGSTGVFPSHYDGEWPKGRWWAHSHGDLWPSRPILFRPKGASDMDSTSDERTSNNVMRHEYRVLSDNEKKQMQLIKDMGLSFYKQVDSIGSSRELSLAKTKIEEAVMWAVKHITG